MYFVHETLNMSLESLAHLLAPYLKKISALPPPLGVLTTGPIVTDVSVSPKVERQGVDYHTALDLVNMDAGEREKWTSLNIASLLGVRDDDADKPDDKKTRFYRRA